MHNVSRKRTLPAIILVTLAALLQHLLCFSAFAVTTGDEAPAFEAPSLAGTNVSLGASKGKVVYLDFWATWCGPCRMTLPWMSDLQKKYKDAGLVVLAVNEDTKRDKAEQALRDLNPAFTPLFDTGGQIASRYAPPGMPSSFLIGRDGRVRLVHKGFREGDGEELEQQIQKLLAEK